MPPSKHSSSDNGVRTSRAVALRDLKLLPELQVSLHCGCSVAKSCPTLLDSMDCSPPGSSVHGILQARTLKKVAISFCRGSS